jgi:hypothetical protein
LIDDEVVMMSVCQIRRGSPMYPMGIYVLTIISTRPIVLVTSKICFLGKNQTDRVTNTRFAKVAIVIQ